jgi:hypothetical protein
MFSLCGDDALHAHSDLKLEVEKSIFGKYVDPKKGAALLRLRRYSKIDRFDDCYFAAQGAFAAHGALAAHGLAAAAHGLHGAFAAHGFAAAHGALAAQGFFVAAHGAAASAVAGAQAAYACVIAIGARATGSAAAALSNILLVGFIGTSPFGYLVWTALNGLSKPRLRRQRKLRLESRLCYGGPQINFFINL